MYKSLSFLIASILALSVLYSCKHKNSPIPIPPIAENKFSTLTSSQALCRYVLQLDSASSHLQVFAIGKSELGKDIPVIRITNPNSSEQKLRVLLFAQQHGNEPSGKEGLLWLLYTLAQKDNLEFMNPLDIYIIPQMNPDGGDLNQRKNANAYDLNRDHLIVKARETQFLHQLFNQVKPQVTVDFHEYYPYSEGWINFGYFRNFDIQLGGLTNANISPEFKQWFRQNTLPEIKTRVEKSGYSVFEYILGYLPEGERMRQSTVDINDGRQSFGVAGTFSVIVEGKRGRDSLDLLERRTKSQFETALAILKHAAHNAKQISHRVDQQRIVLNSKYLDSITIVQEHIPSGDTLRYPLISKNGSDTLFTITNFHNKVQSITKVKVPEGYLIPKSDSLLVNWLQRTQWKTSMLVNESNFAIKQYLLLENNTYILEELNTNIPKVLLTNLNKPIVSGDYIFVPSKQLYQVALVIALEPQSMNGLVNYKDFAYLLKTKNYPILRVEKVTP